MLKNKFAVVLSSLIAMGALTSLASCGTHYDLVIYNWEDYIYEGASDNGNIVDDGIIERFEKFYQEKTGKKIRVAYENFSVNEDMYTQISQGSLKADLVCPSDYMIQKMANEGLLEKFSYNDKTGEYADSLKNFADYGSPFIKSRFKNEKLDDGSSFLQYAVPYFWGTMGFTYNPDYFDEDEVNTWECLWSSEKKFENQFTLKESMRDTYVVGIFHVYKDEIAALDFNAPDYNEKLSAIFNRCDDATISKIKNALIEAKRKTVYGFEVDEGKEEIVKGTYNANLAWSGDAIFAMDNAEEGKTPKTLNYALPKEGSNVWFDGWVMPKGANKELAEEFVNFICDPENAVLCMDAVGYTSPIVGDAMWEYVKETYEAEDDCENTEEVDLSFYFGKEAKIKIDAEERGRQFDAQYPSESDLKRCCMMKDFGAQTEKVEKMWDDIKD